MNIAFPALLIFLLFLPGFIFLTSFRKTERTSLDFRPLAERTVISMVVAGIFHAVWAWLYHGICGDLPDYATTMTLLVGQRGELLEQAVSGAATAPGPIFGYFFSLYLGSWVMGYLFRWSVVRCGWDRKGVLAPWLRFDTPWYYLLKGFDQDADGVLVSAIVEMEGGSHLYSGLLEEHYFDADGSLDRLVLTAVGRRPIENDKPSPIRTEGNDLDDGEETRSEERFYPIDGNYFVLRMSEITTLNIHYVKLADELEAADETSGL